MLEQLGSLLSSPWVYALIAASVLLDVFLPVLPSGALVAAAATVETAGHTVEGFEVAGLLVCAATASCLGDLAAYRLAWRGSEWLQRRFERSRRLAAAQDRLGAALSRGGGGLVVLARFAPAGRSVVSLGAGAAHRTVAEFVPWSALAGSAWAAYSVGLGCLGGHWFGATWFGTAVSCAALSGVGSAVAWLLRPSGSANARAASEPDPASTRAQAPRGPKLIDRAGSASGAWLIPPSRCRARRKRGTSDVSPGGGVSRRESVRCGG